MSRVASASSGKGHRDENFPVASRLISPRHRGPILAFYRFVRAADDVADNAGLTPSEKIALLDDMEAALLGAAPPSPEAEPLRLALAERGLPARHAQDLLEAFRLDAMKSRYADWDELLHYCSLSAMPVGRFVLDLHGESHATWPASDALCAALQVINHLQDCAEDFRELDRVYLPDTILQAHGAETSDLGGRCASPPLLAALRDVNRRCARLLGESAAFPSLVADPRLGLEVAVIQRLAEVLVGKLARRDPLAERVQAGKAEAAASALSAILRAIWARRRGPVALTQKSPS